MHGEVGARAGQQLPGGAVGAAARTGSIDHPGPRGAPAHRRAGAVGHVAAVRIH